MFVATPGDWSTFGTSTGQPQFLGIESEFTITQDFVCDVASDKTIFGAID